MNPSLFARYPALPALLVMPTETPFDSLFWLLFALCAIATAAAVAVWILVVRMKRLEAQLARRGSVEDLSAALTKAFEGRDALDLRRVEHVLLDIRDGQKRVEDRLIAVVESRERAALAGDDGSRALVPALGSGPSAGRALADRIVTRLIALGYERVQLVTPSSELAALESEGGDVVVEARRDGSPCKGKVRVANGIIADVQIQSAYSTFP